MQPRCERYNKSARVVDFRFGPERIAQNPEGAVMQQITDWLEKLGMSEYGQRFAENDIDMAVLPDLTEQHLKDLGVSLGHRLKMRRAISDLSNVSAAVTAP